MNGNQNIGQQGNRQPAQQDAVVKGLMWIIVLDYIGGGIFILALIRCLTNEYPDGPVVIAFIALAILVFFLSAYALNRVRKRRPLPRPLGWALVAGSAITCLRYLTNLIFSFSGEFTAGDAATPADAGTFIGSVLFLGVTVLPLAMSAYKIAVTLIRSKEEPRKDGRQDYAGVLINSAYALSITARNAAPYAKDQETSVLLQSIVTKTDDIAQFVQLHAETAESISALGTYYMPTATQLIQTFIEMHEYESEKARSTEESIVRTLAIFNSELGEILDDLIENQGCNIDGLMEAMKLRLELEDF